MASTTADFLLDRLAAWGVDTLYGYPGDGINAILGSLGGEAGKPFRFIQARHEEDAAFMACAHAKWTGEPGVCLATSGPGAIHLLNGLYDAKLDHQPVVAILGQQDRSAIGTSFQQEIDLLSLFKDVAHEYVHMCAAPSQMRHLVDRAIRIAKAKRCVTAIIVPDDVAQEAAVESPPHTHGTTRSGVGHAPRPLAVPPADALRAAADVLNACERIAILVGAGAMGAGPQVVAVAERLGAGVAKALLGKAVLPDDLPFVTGQIGLLGTSPSWNMMDGCDGLLMVGSGFPYAEYLPEEGKARGVQIDIDPANLSLRYPMEVNLEGDAAATLEALLPFLTEKTDRRWRETIESEVETWWQGVEKRSRAPADPINPELIFWEASSRLPDRSIVTADSGTSANWFARAIRIREGMMASLSGTLATMCPAIPYATAAKFTHPDRFAVAFTGDGAMQMLGFGELITIAKYYKTWADPRLLVVVLNNRDLAQVTWEQRGMGGYPKVEETQSLPDVNYAAFAELIGLRGYRVETPEEVVPALDAALAADRPVLIDAVVDANVPTLPPGTPRKQVANFFKMLMKGDADTSAIIRQTVRRHTG